MLKATTSRVRSKPPLRRIAAQVIRFHAGLNLARRLTTVAHPPKYIKLPRRPNDGESVKATANEINAPPNNSESVKATANEIIGVQPRRSVIAPSKRRQTKLTRPDATRFARLERRRVEASKSRCFSSGGCFAVSDLKRASNAFTLATRARRRSISSGCKANAANLSLRRLQSFF